MSTSYEDKSETVLQMLADFVDGDDRTMTINDPDMSLDLGDSVYSLQSFLQSNNVLVGDKAGANFSEFRYANLVSTDRRIFTFD